LSPILSGPYPKARLTEGIQTAYLTDGEKVCRFIETHCVVPEGDLVGQPVRLADFQRLFLLAVYDNPAGTDTAILSIGRKNAKTALIAFVVLAHLVGPRAVQNSRIISGALSREQAAEVFTAAAKCVRLSDKLRPLVRIVPSTKLLVGLPMSVEYQAISAEATTAHGKSPIVAIIDEAGQVRGPKSDFIDAITTAQGAYKDPLLVYISTQAANDGDLLSILIDDAKRNKPAKTVCHVYEAPPSAAIMDEDGWAAANPALGLFRSVADVRKQAEKAARMPSFENTFRNLILNQRVSRFSPFVSRDVWKRNGKPPGALEGCRVFGGLDLSSRTDLTAAVFVSDRPGGFVDTWPFFWTPEEGLLERSNRDRQPYDVWVRQGFLRTTPGHTVDYEFVLADLQEILEGAEVEGVAFDRWHIQYFRKECDRAGVDLKLVEFGQGFRDMAPAVDTLEELLLNGKVNHGRHPVLTMCAANATTTKDAAGNRKLDKAKSTGRVDGMVALAMALGARGKTPPEEGGDYMDFLRNPVIV
jgi:phage terminase large subunit-like protein